jgi:hypothetical protein
MFLDAPEGGKFYVPKSAISVEVEIAPADLALQDGDFLNRYLAPAASLIQHMAHKKGII